MFEHQDQDARWIIDKIHLVKLDEGGALYKLDDATTSGVAIIIIFIADCRLHAMHIAKWKWMQSYQYQYGKLFI